MEWRGTARRAKQKIIRVERNLACVFRILSAPRHAKYFSRWLRSMRRPLDWNAPQPWITFAAIDFLESKLAPKLEVFEYGSGMSTLYWMSHDAHCVSIEHDPEWYATLKPMLSGNRAVDYRLIRPQVLQDAGIHDAANPELYLSEDAPSAGLGFRNYASQIDQFPDAAFDIVFVDGRARPSCVRHSHSKVKRGGLLILDNSDREYYLRHTAPFLEQFDRMVFRGPTPGSAVFTETSVFVRRMTT
jgi:hypothetical protein